MPLLKFWGNWVIRSLMSVLPVVSMDCDEMTWMGLVLVSFGAAMREPVTMTSWSAGAAAPSEGAGAGTV
jgi:hypothetical protein